MVHQDQEAAVGVVEGVGAAAGPSSVPAPDGGWTTLFRWRGGPAAVEFESWSAPVPMVRWRDTDCWYAEVRMPARLRVTYRIRAGDEWYADPLNPVGAGGERSIAATPDAPPQPHWPAVGADDVLPLPLPPTRIRWASGRLGGRRTVRVHPVAGGGPVVLLLDGDDWLYLHPAVTAFDAAAAAGELPPVTLVFLPAGDRLAEYACRPEPWEAVREELLPRVADCGVPGDPDRLGEGEAGVDRLAGVHPGVDRAGDVEVQRLAHQEAARGRDADAVCGGGGLDERRGDPVRCRHVDLW
ncbi:alpha/beta hydrolase-fold protein [Kitasatospora purpeofusca]|uniref:alpha/beta hydrolase-fold protein n=1 Tax=Kitasatospora purpeofusca TaxID=67352 RepID=UPI003247B818